MFRLAVLVAILACVFGDESKPYHHTCNHDHLKTRKATADVPYSSKTGPLRIHLHGDQLVKDLKKTEDVVNALNLVQKAATKMSSLLDVTRVRGNLVLKNREGMTWCGSAHIPEQHRTTGVPDADVVIYVRAIHERKCIHRSGLFASADVCVYDESGRPVAGVLLFCPSKLRSVGRLEEEEVLHQLVHILLVSKPTMARAGFSMDTQRMSDGSLNTLLMTPTVAKLSQIHHQCPTSKGVFIAGSHFKSSHMFGELMSIHDSSITDVPMKIMSHFTLALFHDSPWYSLRVDIRTADQYGVGLVTGCEYLKEAAPGLNVASVSPERDHPALSDVLRDVHSRKPHKRRLLPDTYVTADKTAILARHNDLRSQQAIGQFHGPASDMRELIWDSDLESGAQSWTDTCNYNHDSSSNRQSVSKKASWVGQNIAMGSGGFYNSQNGVLSLVQSWWDEYTDWTYATTFPGSCSGVCGHYTQMTWAATSNLGCGLTIGCSTWPIYMACNYHEGGNFGSRSVFKKATACSACPSGTSCSNNLCSTGGGGGGGPNPAPQPVQNPVSTTTRQPTPQPTTPPPTNPSACDNSGWTWTITLGFYFDTLGASQAIYQEALLQARPCIISVIETIYQQKAWYQYDYVKFKFTAKEAVYTDYQNNKDQWKVDIHSAAQNNPGTSAASSIGAPVANPPAATSSCQGTGCPASSTSGSQNGGSGESKPESKTPMILGIVFGILACCLIVGGCVFFQHKKKAADTRQYHMLDEQERYAPPM